MNAAVNNHLTVFTFAQGDHSTKAVIGLHGWTGDEQAILPLAKSVNIKNVKWYFPRAPYLADTGKGFTWFSGSDEKGWKYEKSWIGMDYLLGDIQREGFLLENIYMVGFSQGATMVMEYTMRLPLSLGGIVPIAGFIKNRQKLEQEANPASRETSVLLMHGDRDEIVHLKGSKMAYNFFSQRGNPVQLEIYSAAHKIPLKSSSLIRNFIEHGTSLKH